MHRLGPRIGLAVAALAGLLMLAYGPTGRQRVRTAAADDAPAATASARDVPDDPLGHLCEPDDAQRCTCFANGTPDLYRRLFERVRPNLPPGAMHYQSGQRWTFTATDGAAGSGESVTLTYSFVPDYNTGDANTSNVLHARLDALFGSRAAWRSLFAEVFASWGALAGVRFIEVSDDGATWPDSTGAAGERGDIRIISTAIDGAYGVLAYAYLPNYGDLCLDRAEDWADPTDNHRFFRNTILHELGHAIGLQHVLPQDGTKLMEAMLNLDFAGPQDDDVRGANAFYGDAREPNGSGEESFDLGMFTDGLSITQLSVHSADEDWFFVAAAGGTLVSAEAAPVGGTYLVSPDPGTPAAINTLTRAALRLEIYDTDGLTRLTTSSAAAGQTARTNTVILPAEDDGFLLRVLAAGANADVQRYTLTLTAGEPQEWTLSLTSTPSAGAAIALSPASVGSAISATTPGSADYFNGQLVTLTAPQSHAGGTFVRWSVDGETQAFGARQIGVLMDSDRGALAEYTTTLAVDAGEDESIVLGESAPLTVAVIGGTQPLTYSWYPPDGLDDAASATPTAQPTGTTTYTVTVTDAALNSAADSVRVSVLGALAATATTEATVAKSAAFPLSAAATGGSPPYSYHWEPAEDVDEADSAQTTATISRDTTFELTVTDAEGRTATDEVDVLAADALIVEVDSPRRVLLGESISLSASVDGGIAPYGYVWSPAGAGNVTSGATIDVSPAQTTVYTVTVLDSVGQEESADIRVVVGSDMDVEIDAPVTTVAPGQSVLLAALVDGGLPPFAYTWGPSESLHSDDEMEVEAHPAETTEYMVLVTDSLGQEASATIVITVAPLDVSPVVPTCGLGLGFAAPGIALGLATARRRARREATRRPSATASDV